MPIDDDSFDFDRVGVTTTKTKRFADDPREPPATGCEFYGCQRKKNLWPWEFDEKVIWLCWPHYRRYKHRPPPYKGRVRHHDLGTKFIDAPDYPVRERDRHRELVKRIESGSWLR